MQSPSASDPPHIKAIAPNSLASGPKYTKLVPGLVLHSIQNRSVWPLELKVRTPAHTKHLGWYLEFEFRVMQVVGVAFKDIMGMLKEAGRPLSMKFTESVLSRYGAADSGSVRDPERRSPLWITRGALRSCDCRLTAMLCCGLGHAGLRRRGHRHDGQHGRHWQHDDLRVPGGRKFAQRRSFLCPPLRFRGHFAASRSKQSPSRSQGPLGITFISESADGSPPIIIKQISPTGLAAKQSHGLLKAGLQLLTVNGLNVADSPLKPAIAAIKSAGRPLTLQLSATPVESAADLSTGVGGVVGGIEPKLGEYKLLVDCVCYEGAALNSAKVTRRRWTDRDRCIFAARRHHRRHGNRS